MKTPKSDFLLIVWIKLGILAGLWFVGCAIYYASIGIGPFSYAGLVAIIPLLVFVGLPLFIGLIYFILFVWD